MYDKLLIPTDGSEQAGNAVQTGLNLAAELGATVHTLYVVEEFEGRIVPITGEQEERSRQYHEHGEEIVTEVAAEEMDVDCVTTVADGVVHNEIQRYIEEHDIDFIVMGSRGASRVQQALMGSTADRIIRTIDKPVTVVHEEPDRSLRLEGW